MEEPPKDDSFVLRLLHRFGLHPFSRVILAKKVPETKELLQPAGEPLPMPEQDME